MGEKLAEVGRKGLAARRRYFEALQVAYNEAAQLGVTLRWARFDHIEEKLRNGQGSRF